jgi:hypothetical protein
MDDPKTRDAKLPKSRDAKEPKEKKPRKKKTVPIVIKIEKGSFVVSFD